MGLISADLVQFLHAGHSLLVGSRDDARRPEATRAVAIVVGDDRTHVTLYLPDAAGARTLANLAVAPVIAVACSAAVDLRSVQLKGVVVAQRPARDDERAVVEAYRERFASHLTVVGMARGLTRRLRVWPCHAVEIEMRELFDQSPGPGAGGPLPGAAS